MPLTRLHCIIREDNFEITMQCFLYVKSKILMERALLIFYFHLFSQIPEVYRIRIENSVVAVQANFENR